MLGLWRKKNKRTHPDTLFICCCSLVAQSCPTLLWPHGQTIARQVPLSIGFPRQESWNEVPFPSPGIFPILGLNPHLLHWELDSSLSHVGSPPCLYTNIINFMCLQQFTHKIWLQYQIDMLIVLFLLVNNFNKTCWFSSGKIRGLGTPKQLSSEFSCTAGEPTYSSFLGVGDYYSHLSLFIMQRNFGGYIFSLFNLF